MYGFPSRTGQLIGKLALALRPEWFILCRHDGTCTSSAIGEQESRPIGAASAALRFR